MRITAPDNDVYWQQLAVHTVAGRLNGNVGAPWTLQLRAAALIGHADIEASIASFDGAEPTTWAVTMMTADGRLVRLRMQFDAEDYDSERDGDGTNPVPAKVIESWVRQLDDVVSLGIGNARMRPNSFNQPMPGVLDVGDVSLTLNDGTLVDLGIDQVAMTGYDDRRRSDYFIDVLRSRTGL